MPHSTVARWLGVLSVFLLLMSACDGTTDDTSLDGEPSSPSVAVRSLLYATADEVFVYDLEAGSSTGFIAVPGKHLSLSPDGEALAFTSRGAGGDPQISVVPVASTDASPVDLGPGDTPAWSPDSQSLAAVVLAEGSQICGDQGEGECMAVSQIVVYRPGDEADGPVTVMGLSAWTLIGWVESGVLAADRAFRTTSWGKPGQDSEGTQRFGWSPQQMWGGSPVAPLFLVTPPGEKFFVDNTGSRQAGIDVQGKLGPGAWSPDGSHVVVSLEVGGRRSLVMIEVETGATEIIEGSDDPLPEVVWTPDGASFAFAAADRVTMCSVSLDCETLFETESAVHLLGFSEQSP